MCGCTHLSDIRPAVRACDTAEGPACLLLVTCEAVCKDGGPWSNGQGLEPLPERWQTCRHLGLSSLICPAGTVRCHHRDRESWGGEAPEEKDLQGRHTQVQRERAGESSRRVQWWWRTREKFLEREGVAEPSMVKGTTEGPYARLVTAVPGDPRRAVSAGCWGGGRDCLSRSRREEGVGPPGQGRRQS